jgi:hypothetical protein
VRCRRMLGSSMARRAHGAFECSSWRWRAHALHDARCLRVPVAPRAPTDVLEGLGDRALELPAQLQDAVAMYALGSGSQVCGPCACVACCAGLRECGCVCEKRWWKGGRRSSQD